MERRAEYSLFCRHAGSEIFWDLRTTYVYVPDYELFSSEAIVQEYYGSRNETGDWVDLIAKPGYKPHLAPHYYIVVMQGTVAMSPYEDILYNFTTPSLYGYPADRGLMLVACTTGISLVERTSEWGTVTITSPTSNLIHMANDWMASARARGMKESQILPLLSSLPPLRNAATGMLFTASSLFGNDLEILNFKRLVDGNVIPTRDLSVAGHFRFMAQQHQRATRAQLLGDFLGKLYSDDVERTQLPGSDAWVPNLVANTHVVCPGYTISIIRILIIFAPIVGLTLIVLVFKSIPISIFEILARKYPRTQWILQRRLSRDAVLVQGLAGLVGHLLQGSEGPEKRLVRGGLVEKKARVQPVVTQPAVGGEILHVEYAVESKDGQAIV